MTHAPPPSGIGSLFEFPPRRVHTRRTVYIVLAVLAVLLVLPLCLCGGAMLLPFSMVGGLVTTSEPYRAVMERLAGDPRVVARLGTPIEQTEVRTMSVKQHNSQGEAVFDFSVRGPSGEAEVDAACEHAAGGWRITRLRVTFDDGSHLDIAEVEP